MDAAEKGARKKKDIPTNKECPPSLPLQHRFACLALRPSFSLILAGPCGSVAKMFIRDAHPCFLRCGRQRDVERRGSRLRRGRHAFLALSSSLSRPPPLFFYAPRSCELQRSVVYCALGVSSECDRRLKTSSNGGASPSASPWRALSLAFSSCAREVAARADAHCQTPPSKDAAERERSREERWGKSALLHGCCASSVHLLRPPRAPRHDTYPRTTSTKSQPHPRLPFPLLTHPTLHFVRLPAWCGAMSSCSVARTTPAPPSCPSSSRARGWKTRAPTAHRAACLTSPDDGKAAWRRHRRGPRVSSPPTTRCARLSTRVVAHQHATRPSLPIAYAQRFNNKCK